VWFRGAGHELAVPLTGRGTSCARVPWVAPLFGASVLTLAWHDFELRAFVRHSSISMAVYRADLATSTHVSGIAGLEDGLLV
jgi:hypothetical protein